MLGLEPLLDNDDASDPFYLSPKLAINKGRVEDGGGEAPEEQSTEEAAQDMIEEGIIFDMEELVDYRLLGIENGEDLA